MNDSDFIDDDEYEAVDDVDTPSSSTSIVPIMPPASGRILKTAKRSRSSIFNGKLTPFCSALLYL